MNRIIIIVFAVLCVFIFSCKREKLERTRYLSYNANPAYTGSHSTANLSSNISIKEKEDYMQFNVDLPGGDVSKTYIMRICKRDTNSIYGYDTIPFISLGTMYQNIPVIAEVSNISFNEMFYENFHAYYMVQDPENISNDTTTLLIFGKIGNW